MSVPQVFAKRDHNLNIFFWWIIRLLTSKNIAMIQHRDYHLPFHSILIVGLLIAGILSANALEQKTAQLVVETTAGKHILSVEIADTDATRAKGLMHRTSMAEDHGMLFWFANPRPVTMWMKDTPLPLDMVFILPNGKVHRIAAHTKPHSLDYIHAGAEVSGVLELNAGAASRLDLKPGDQIRLK
jgi:uncharacterized membrane protein (UPF0127 family)